MVFREHVKNVVPSSWDPAALARFIETFGTNIIVGVKMSGKDVIYVRQQHASPLQPADVQKSCERVLIIDKEDTAIQGTHNSIQHSRREAIDELVEKETGAAYGYYQYSINLSRNPSLGIVRPSEQRRDNGDETNGQRRSNRLKVSNRESPNHA